MFDLNGKVAIVTGGNGGIGLGMARGLARAGARVVVAARNVGKSDQAIVELKAFGPEALAVAVDVTDEQSVNSLVSEVMAHCGRVDILISNAGTSIRNKPELLTIDDWHHVLDTNLTSAFLCARAVYPHLCAAGGGKIINVGSILSIFGAPHAAAYGASKGAIVQLTKSLATAWASDNIQVNTILPGWIETELTDRAREQVPGLYERVLARTPAKRWGQIDDLAGAAVFLASAASDFVTGTSLTVDGGYSVPG